MPQLCNCIILIPSFVICDLEAETEGDRMMWERFQEAAGTMQGMFTMRDVEEAMKASNFNKGLGPDGFDGTILRPGDTSHRLT